MRLVLQPDIVRMNELYLQLKTYAAVSRATGFAPSTVKKYIKKDYISQDKRVIKHFNGDLPKFEDLNIHPFLEDDWGALCTLSDEEYKEIKEIWGEIDI